MPMAAVIVTMAIEPQFALPRVLNDPVSKSPVPLGSSTNMNGTRNAGVVYFQHCSVVLYGSPTMIPAPAHVAATLRTLSEPPESAFITPEFHRPRPIGCLPVKTSHETSAVSRRRKLVSAETTVAQNTDSTGE